jgi:hypothetical protein
MQTALRLGHWSWAGATTCGRCAVRNEWTERSDAAIPLGSEKGDLVTPNALRDSGLMAGIPAGMTMLTRIARSTMREGPSRRSVRSTNRCHPCRDGNAHADREEYDARNTLTAEREEYKLLPSLPGWKCGDGPLDLLGKWDGGVSQ